MHISIPIDSLAASQITPMPCVHVEASNNHTESTSYYLVVVTTQRRQGGPNAQVAALQHGSLTTPRQILVHHSYVFLATDRLCCIEHTRSMSQIRKDLQLKSVVEAWPPLLRHQPLNLQLTMSATPTHAWARPWGAGALPRWDSDIDQAMPKPTLFAS